MEDEKQITPEQAEPRKMEIPSDILSLLSQKVIGQPTAMNRIVPYVHMFLSGLSPEDRPAGVFLLLGPTGTGKTKTVEAIAEVLHQDPKKILKIDCGEYQMEHEVAKLLGAPPGYLGHRETVPLLTQERLKEVASDACDLALVLFDEIEKAAPSLARLLLGILDKGILRLGDNTTVNFEKSLVFFTSNLGAGEMMKEMNPGIGFQSAIPKNREELVGKLENIALGAVRKKFSPEFVNRIDAVVTYQPLDSEALREILKMNLDELQKHVNKRLGERGFTFEISELSKGYLLEKGTSEEYGARELKRTIHRNITQPLATLVASGKVGAGSLVRVELSEDGESLELIADNTYEAVETQTPKVLIVDDNRDLRLFLEQLLKESGWELEVAGSTKEALKLFSEYKPDVVILDYMLGRDDGVKLGRELQASTPQTQVIIMTGGNLPPDAQVVCQALGYPVLFKPFFPNELVDLVRARLQKIKPKPVKKLEASKNV